MEIQIDRPATGTVGFPRTGAYVSHPSTPFFAETLENNGNISKHELLLKINRTLFLLLKMKNIQFSVVFPSGCQGGQVDSEDD